ncbi:MAG: type II toxin-antitoxin system RelE/ParE family toxin [Vulcanimicrobiota bacterium]
MGSKWDIEFLKSANKDLKKLDQHARQQIGKELELLAQESPTCDIKKLRTRKSIWRLKVGNHRVLFQRDKQRLIILVIEISRRSKSTYK